MNAKVFKMVVGMVACMFCLMNMITIQAKAARSELEKWIADIEESEEYYSVEFTSILKEVSNEGYDDGMIIDTAKLLGGVYTQTDTLTMVDYETKKAVKIVLTYNEKHKCYLSDDDVVDMVMYRSNPFEIDVNLETVYWFE